MEKQIVQVEVASSTYKVGQHLASFIAAVKQALSDGWQPGQDLPAVITAAVADLVPAVGEVQEASQELGETQAFVNAVYLSLSPVAFALIDKKA